MSVPAQHTKAMSVKVCFPYDRRRSIARNMSHAGKWLLSNNREIVTDLPRYLGTSLNPGRGWRRTGEKGRGERREESPPCVSLSFQSPLGEKAIKNKTKQKNGNASYEGYSRRKKSSLDRIR